MGRKLSASGLAMIKHFEGCRLRAYKDSGGVFTIGYGATRGLDGASVKSGLVITQKEADALLARDIGGAEHFVDTYLARGVWAINPAGEKVWVPMPQSVFDGQVSLAYNIGNAAWQRSTQLKMLNNGSYIEWKKQNA